MGRQQYYDLNSINKEIEDLRDVLNEVAADDESSPKKVLEISQQLDKLIVEYTKREILEKRRAVR
ncbi:Spo0E family sporulation regulatory protein-aspartic acid phosphatase [Clostridium bovifaecis]|uniref:Spo0E family sporulation regulatory protein-aspartic acid phosphatase n=1 Tax=Clostridium bovifaecis TaxID=2184719 RepID=A0A6I6EU84_9CLOT|nr:Spo0E family sporulation regulatory protein-aspartic acid phosphatase [Clostridium bovifaecis]